MSVSLWLEIDTGGSCRASVTESVGITYNVSPMFRKAGIELKELSDVVAGEAVERLDNAVKYFTANRAELEKLNPPNGWGSYDSAKSFLEHLLEDCRSHPKAVISGSY